MRPSPWPMSDPDSLRHVEANGLRFAYFERGEGPLVLALHGFPDTAHTWDAVRPALAADGYRVVTPFMRGYPPTQIPARDDYDADTLGRDALALIEALGERAAVLLGHDWGASAAFSAVGLAPERVRALVTMAVPHPARLRPTPRLLWTFRHFVTLTLPGAAARARKDDFATIDALVRRWSPAWDVPASETAAVKRCFAQPGALEAALGYYRALRPRPPQSQRRKVAAPSAAFAGTEDVISPELYEAARPQYLEHYEVVRVPGGHFMHREHPEIFTRELRRVLKELLA
ncbi:MAG: alpha/beta hydrolase [Myxococcales bacterium]|nr:alpha/beta hydrolase [Myxococcales bacterium]